MKGKMLSPSSFSNSMDSDGQRPQSTQKRGAVSKAKAEKKAPIIKEKEIVKPRWYRLRKSFLSDHEQNSKRMNSRSYSASQSDNSANLQTSEISAVTETDLDINKTKEASPNDLMTAKRRTNRTQKAPDRGHQGRNMR